MYENLSGTRFQARFLDNVNLVLRIVECGNIGITRRLLVGLEDPEVGVLQDYLGIVELSIRGCDLDRHCAWNTSERILMDD